MENFKGVMVGATNFMDNLDAAIMRRFTFKLQFDYLEADGKKIAVVQSYKAKAHRTGRTVEAFGENYAEPETL